MKICTKCNIEQPESEFYLKRGKPRSDCKICHAKYCRNQYKVKNEQYLITIRAWRKNNPEKDKSRAFRSLYGINYQDYNNMFNEQKGCCAICGRHQSLFKKRLSVDHCHITKKVRGLLCHNCNFSLGGFFDKIELLENAIKYLKKD